MNKIKTAIEFLKGFGKFLTTSMTGKIAIWGSVIMLGVTKHIMVIMDMAFAEDCRKARSENNTSTDTEN